MKTDPESKFSDSLDSLESASTFMRLARIGTWRLNPQNQSLEIDTIGRSLLNLPGDDSLLSLGDFYEILHPDDRQIVHKYHTKYYCSERQTSEICYRIRGEGDTWRWILERGQTAGDDTKDSRFPVGMMIDITTHKGTKIRDTEPHKLRGKEPLLEVKISRLIDYFNSVFEHLPGFITLRTSDQSCLIATSSYKEMCAKPTDTLDSFLNATLLKERSDKLINDEKNELFIKPETGRYQKKLDLHDGSTRTFEVAEFPVFDSDDNLIFSTLVAIDITDLTKLKKELETQSLIAIQSAKLASLGEMAAGVAHEINNPLAIILASCHLLTINSDDLAQRESLINRIEKATNRIAKIVSGLRKYSRQTPGIIIKAESVSNMVSAALDLLSPKLDQYGIDLKVKVERNLELSCDSIEIEQVLVNLISNSIDAIKSLELKWIEIEGFHDKDKVILRVLDSGPGVSSDIEKSIFEPFFTTKEIGEGTGLGLSVSQGILKKHKASIKLNRDLGPTCFEVVFPKT